MSPVSVVIATKNRKDGLRDAVASALRQRPGVEVIVLDDGSTDGTSAMLADEFPSVRLIRSEESQGYIVQRNRGVEAAKSDFVVIIDDDCTFESPDTINIALGDMQHPLVGAVAMPFINTKRGPQVRKSAPSGGGVFITPSFIGCAHMLRRDQFLRLGGYWLPLRHYWEESDYCYRLLGAGYATRLGTSPPVLHHYTDVARGTRRQRYFAARNTCMFAWHNVPWPYFPLHLAGVTLREFKACLRFGYPGATAHGVFRGWLDGAKERVGCRPPPAEVYRLYRRIKASEPLDLEVVRAQLEGLKTREGSLPELGRER